MRIDNSGNVLIGDLRESVQGAIHSITGVSKEVPVSIMARGSSSVDHTAVLNFFRTRATSGNYTATASGDRLGKIRFYGVNTSSVADIGAEIFVEQNGTSASTVPADMHFKTNEVTRMTIDSNGLVNFGNQTDYISLNGANGIINRVKTGSGNADIRFQLDGADYAQLKDTVAPGMLSMGYTGATSNNSIAAFHGLSNDATMVLSNTQSSGNATSYGWAGRGGRYLTSNGTNWAADGQDAILVIGSNSPGYSGVPTGLGVSLGIIMHNESPNNNIFSPLLGFGKKSASGSYNTMYSYIAGKSKSTGADGNWATGEIHMDTAGHITSTTGSNMYMNDNPAFRLSQSGALHLTSQPHSTGHFGSSNLTNATGWSMTQDSIYGFSYINHPTHGLGLSCLEEGYYQCHAAGLVNGSGTYLYVGWCVNGVQHYHWHSNHTYTNHDFYASVLVYLSVGDFLTIENGSQTMVSQWGGNHSFYSVWKVG